jgi:hypothetical protein
LQAVGRPRKGAFVFENLNQEAVCTRLVHL